MKSLFAILALFSISFTLHAQVKKTNCYLIDSKGDSLRTYVKFSKFQMRTRQAYSYINRNGKPDSIKAENIKLLVFDNGKRFERAFVNSASGFGERLSRTEIDTLITLKGYVLVERILEGPTSLYYFMDFHFNEHFLIKGFSDSAINELVYSEYVSNAGDGYLGLNIRANIHFKYYLRDYINRNIPECSHLNVEVWNLEYKRKNIVDFIKTLNECTSQHTATVIDQKK